MTSVVQTLLARTGIAAILGLQMGGRRDLYNVFGWNSRPQHRDFVNKYLRQDIAKRVIDAPVDALWSDPPLIAGDPAFTKAWNDLLAQIPVFANLQKLDTLAGLGQYAIMVVGLDDGQQLDQPVSPVRTAGKQRKVLYLQPYAEGSVAVKTYETNQSNPRFGLPVIYTVDPGTFASQTSNTVSAGLSPTGKSFNVHWSRVLHVAEGSLESQVFGRSRLECVYNVLDDILKVSGGSAETFWLNANRGLHVDVDKEMELDADDANKLSDELDEYSNQLRRVIRTRGVKVSSLGADVLDPRGVFDVQLSLLASATGIPKRVLAGSEAGQLASQQDRANWALQVEQRVSKYGSPIMLLPFLRLLIDTAVLPRPTQMSITWPDAFKMNPLERAQTSAQMARSAANLSKTLLNVQQINHANAVDSMPVVTPLGGGGFGGGGFGANATATPPAKSTSDPSSGSGASSPDATKSQTMTTPALFDKKPPTLVLLTEDECRSIIGFGKHMPVFDDSQDAVHAIGTSDPSIVNPSAEV